MQREALYFKQAEGDFEIIILTNDDLYYSWQKFQGRIGHSKASTYCRYTASEVGKWKLFDYKVGNLIEIGNPELAHPVIFETNKYHICIYFAKGIKNPQIVHVRKDVERWFSEDPKAKADGAPKLEGDTVFLNEPGVFKLQFEYSKNDRQKNCFITFDVVSPKMDTKENYKSLLAVVNREYENVIFRYLSTTYQQFRRGRLKNDEIWLSSFEQVIEEYLKGLRTILRAPHTRMTQLFESDNAERIRHWTPRMEEEYAEVYKEGKQETHHFRYEQTLRKVDSNENRFVKHTLFTIGSRLNRVLATIRRTLHGKDAELSDLYDKRLHEYQDKLHKIQKHPFWKSIGKFSGGISESLVLQSRQGYLQVYRAWLLLRKGIDLYSGKSNIGTLQIWEIYELWCFIKMKHLVMEVLYSEPNKEFDPYNINPDYESLINEPKGSIMNAFSNTKLEYVVEFRYPKGHKLNGDIVSLHYQHTFNRRNQDDDLIHTATTEQRPDIVLNIKKGGEKDIVLTYLYDVKYRVWNDKRLDIDLEDADISEMEKLGIKGADYPPSDAINQMHRYRDAIYYGTDIHMHSNKEIIGGYVLFPGRGDNDTIANRYYQRSMETVNIGAIPLLPYAKKNDETEEREGFLLFQHLNAILQQKSEVIQHVEKAVPQRTLAYVKEEEKENMLPNDLVMIALSGSTTQRQWTFENRWYNIPLDKIADTPWMKATYLLLHTPGEQWVGNLRKIVKTKHDVWTSERLINKGYPSNPSYPAYFMMRILSEAYTERDLRSLQFDVKKISSEAIYWGNQKMPFMLVKLKQLLNRTAIV